MAGDVVFLVLVLQRVGDVDEPIEILDPERGIPLGQIGISERLHELERAVEHVDGGREEVGGVQEVAAGPAGDGEPLVDGGPSRIYRHRDHRLVRRRRGRDPRTPPGDGPVLAGEDEERGAAVHAIRHDEAGAAVEDQPGRRARHVDFQRELGAGRPVVERGGAGLVVRHPPRREGARRQAPGVDQVRILQVRLPGEVGDEVVLHVGAVGGKAHAVQDRKDREQYDRDECVHSHCRILSAWGYRTVVDLGRRGSHASTSKRYARSPGYSRMELNSDSSTKDMRRFSTRPRCTTGAHRESRGYLVSARGSKASRSPSPTTLKASTASMMNPPGKSETQGATERNSLPSFRMVPHEGVGGWTPTPR